MNEYRLNKAIAGYRMLMLLSNLDGNFTAGEGKLIVDYLEKNFPFRVNLDEEIEMISGLDSSEYFPVFLSAMDDFYFDSTPKERAEFVDFAVRLVKADKKFSKDENIFLRELLNAWDPETIE